MSSELEAIHHAVLGGTASSAQLLQVKEAFEMCASRREAHLSRRKQGGGGRVDYYVDPVVECYPEVGR